MNFFEQELRKIIGQSTAAADASYVGRSCFVRQEEYTRKSEAKRS